MMSRKWSFGKMSHKCFVIMLFSIRLLNFLGLTATWNPYTNSPILTIESIFITLNHLSSLLILPLKSLYCSLKFINNSSILSSWSKSWHFLLYCIVCAFIYEISYCYLDLPNLVITTGVRRKVSRSDSAAPSNICSEHIDMVSFGSKPDDGCNPWYTRRNKGPLSIPVGLGYEALFSPIPGMRYREQTSTQVVHPLEQSGYGLGACKPNLNLHMQTPA